MCPFGHYETVSCKEQSTVAVSICEKKGHILLSYQDSPLGAVEVFQASASYDSNVAVFTRLDDGEDILELIIRRSFDDHTQGYLRTVTAGIQNEFSFRCVTRSPRIRKL